MDYINATHHLVNYINKMSKLMQAQKVKYAVLNAPYLIPQYFKAPYNPIITRGILHKMLNRSCGIEIECFGSLCHNVSDYQGRDDSMRFIDVRNYYNIMNYAEDSPNRHNINPRHDITFNEHKIRIEGHSQLTGLYDILSDMKKYCRLNTASGVHIHVDLSDVFKKHSTRRSEMVALNNIGNHFKKYMQPRLNEIEQIFYPGSKYDGEYNRYKDVSTDKLHHWVAIRNNLKSIEFRIGPMTFEYTDIIRWCVELNKMVNWTINQDPSFASGCKTRISSKKAYIPLIQTLPFIKEEVINHPRNSEYWSTTERMMANGSLAIQEAIDFFRPRGYDIPQEWLDQLPRDEEPNDGYIHDDECVECEDVNCDPPIQVNNVCASQPNIQLVGRIPLFP